MPSLFFKPVELYLKLANLPIKPILLGLMIGFTLLLASIERLTRSIQQLFLPVVDLTGMNLKL